MAGVDPISLAVIGAGVGALSSPKDPIKGAIMGGALGFGGGSLLAAPAAASAAGGAAATGTAAGVGSAGAYQAAVPGLVSAGPGSQAAMLAAQTGEFGLGGLASTAAAGSAPGSLGASLWGGVNKATMPTQGMSSARMAMQGLQMANQQPTQPATGQATFRGAKQTELLEPIQSLLTMAQPRRRERMSLL